MKLFTSLCIIYLLTVRGYRPSATRLRVGCISRREYSNQNTSEEVQASSFNRFTRGIGDVIAYTTGDLSSGLSSVVSFGKGYLGRYIPTGIKGSTGNNETDIISEVVSVSSFKNYSDHALVAPIETEYELPVEIPSVNATSISVDPSQENLPVVSKPGNLLSRIRRRIQPIRGIRSFYKRRFSARTPDVVTESRVRKPGLLKRARDNLALVIRRRIFNIWDRSPASWSKFNSKDTGVYLSKRKSVLTATPVQVVPEKAGPLSAIRGVFQRIFSKEPVEYMDLVDESDESKNFRIFKDQTVDVKLTDQQYVMRSVMNGISTSKEYLSMVNDAGSAFKQMNQLEGLFSDGKNLMSVSVQLLSNATESSLLSGLNMDYIGSAGSLFIKTLASAPSILTKANDSTVQDKLSPPPVDTTPFSESRNRVVDTAVVPDTAFSPLLRFVGRRVFGVDSASSTPVEESTQPPSLLNLVPGVRLLPRVASWTAQRLPKLLPDPSPATPAPWSSARDSFSFLSQDLRPYVSSSTKTAAWSDGSLLRPLPIPTLQNELALPQPTKADMTLIRSTRIEAAVKSALAISSAREFREFMTAIGLKPLLAASIKPPPAKPELRMQAVKALRLLIRFDGKLVPLILAKEKLIETLNEMMQGPFNYGFTVFRSESERRIRTQEQYEALGLVLRLVRESDAAVQLIRRNPRTVKILDQIVATGADIPDDMNTLKASDLGRILRKPAVKAQYSNRTVIVDYDDLLPYQMARVARWAIGGVEWQRRPNQRGLRILSFDGGGTRGVMSIAILKELLLRAGVTDRPFQLFDLISGTSAGGIISVLFGTKRMEMNDVEILYESLIAEIFRETSSLKLLTEKAYYVETGWEQVLSNLVEDELLIDTNKYLCPRVFCVSANVSVVPQRMQLWTNYNYPPTVPASASSFRINTAKAVRITSAAPSYFTAVLQEGSIYVDGAIVANNPTDVAMREAKKLYNEDLELILSIGTGLYSGDSSSYEWSGIANSLICSSTDTERIHEIVDDFYGRDKYFRLNPPLDVNVAIDAKSAETLAYLKQVGKEYVSKYENEQPEKFARLMRLLRYQYN